MTEERKKALKNLKTVRGQIDGIIKMIEEGRYCVDVSNQIMASYALLKRANLDVLEGHLHHCVTESFKNDNSDEKINEVISLLKRMIQ
jgi:DNA-binding FrmR family transcriptional regulator